MLFFKHLRDHKFSLQFQNSLFITLCLTLILAVLCGIIILSSSTARADVSSLTFPNVKIEKGSRIKVAGNRTLYPVSDNTLVSGETSESKYKSEEIEHALLTCIEDSYGSDKIVQSLSNPRLFNIDELYAWRGYMLGSSSAYWLSNSESQGILSWQSYANANNSLNWDNELRIQGRDEENNIDYGSASSAKSLITSGPYAWSKDAQLSDYKPSEGAPFEYFSTENNTLNAYYSGSSFFSKNDAVYNNPECEESGYNSKGFPNAKTTVNEILRKENEYASGYIKDGKIVQVVPRQTLPAGTVMVVRFYQKTTIKYRVLQNNIVVVERSLKDVDNFATIAGAAENNSSILPWNNYQYSEHWQTGFVVLKSDYKVGTSFKESIRVAGMGSYTSADTVVKGDKIEASSFSLKPAYSYNSDAIAFLRSANTSVTSHQVSSKLGSLPSSVARFGKDFKPVVRSNDVSIQLDFNKDSFATNFGDRKQVVLTGDNTIKVPLGSTKLIINNISTVNANRVSVLCGKTDAEMYGIVGEVNNDSSQAEIDLSSFLNTSNIGNSGKITIFAEQINSNGTSDAISAEGLTFNLEVAALGDPQIISFDANGGAGKVPTQVTNKRAGENLTVPDGNDLAKDRNPFSAWKIEYTLFGEDASTIDIVEAGETYVVPDTNNGRLIFSALYSGLTSKKDTDTAATVVTVTWDANGSGQTSSARINGAAKYAQQYAVGTNAIQPNENLLTVPDGYYLDSYNTRADGQGDKVDNSYLSSHSLTANITFYAIWIKYVQVKWQINAPDGTEGGSIGGKDSVIAFYRVGDTISLPTETITNPTDWIFDSWNTASNGGGKDVNDSYLSTNKASTDVVFFGKWRKGYSISWVAGDGTFADGSTTVITTVMPGNAVSGPGVANPSRSGYSFGGWNTKGDGTGERVITSGSSATIPTSDTTYYALWVRDYWIAKAKSSNPITDVHKTTDQIVADISAIKSNNNDTINEYKTIMENDVYHFYMKTGTGTSANDYTEMRIVGVQQESGTAITLMSVHSWGTYVMNSSSSASGGIPNMSLWNNLNGTLWNRIPSTLRSRVVSVNKTYATTAGSSAVSSRYMSLWLPTASELAPVSADIRNEGSQFQLFQGKVTSSSSSVPKKYFGGITGTRSAYLSYNPSSSSVTGDAWLRSPMLTNTRAAFYTLSEYKSGGFLLGGAMEVTMTSSVVPCFCL